MLKSSAFSKEELEKFIDFIEDVSSRTGNEWFGKSLIQRLGSRFPISLNSESQVNPQINEIYEYCITNVLEQQAENMYSRIVNVSLRETLIVDFIRMEKFRREDRFEDFCLAAYQQVEAIVNYILQTHNEYRVRGEQELNDWAFSRYSTKERKMVKSAGNTVGQYLFWNGKEEDKNMDFLPSLQRPFYKWDAFQRVKFMVYYHQFNGQMNYSDVEAYFGLFRKLKNMRDANHRNTEVLDGRKPRDIEDTRSKRSIYYIKFSDLVNQFTLWSMKSDVEK